MSLAIQRSSEFSASSVGFSKLRKNKNGGKTVYLNGSDNKKLYIQLPFMRSPFGLSAFTDEGTGRTSYSLDLSFDPDNADAMDLHDKLKALDDIIVNTVAANSKEWLGKEFNVAVLREALYKPMVRPGKDQYPSTMKLKIATKPDGTFVPEAYSMQKEQVSLDTIEKSQKVMAIVDLSSIWFIDNKFGVTMRLQQCLLEQSAKLPAFAFQGLDFPEKKKKSTTTLKLTMKNKYIIYLPNPKIDTSVSSICMNLFLVCNKYGQTLGPRPYRQQRQDRCPEERGR
jgi:hypothetical protein